MYEKIKIGAIYRHYKNHQLYQVIAVGKNSETLEDIVIYKALYKGKNFPKNQVWCRPLSIWQEKIDGKPRFEIVDKMLYDVIEFNSLQNNKQR